MEVLMVYDFHSFSKQVKLLIRAIPL